MSFRIGVLPTKDIKAGIYGEEPGIEKKADIQVKQILAVCRRKKARSWLDTGGISHISVVKGNFFRRCEGARGP
ncbi:MAG: hypothetical protein V1792_07250 [Pseudomonadota bacterium]